MPIRNPFQHRERANSHHVEIALPNEADPASAHQVPQVTIVRSDTHTQEVLTVPVFGQDDEEDKSKGSRPATPEPSPQHGRASRIFKKRANSTSGAPLPPKSGPAAAPSSPSKATRPGLTSRKFSERLSMRRSVSSSHVPDDLPTIRVTDDPEYNGAEWEQRATILARENERQRSRPASPTRAATVATMNRQFGAMGLSTESPTSRPVSSQDTDVNIQEAIRLHEEGELEASTRMFARLADPHGENNALSQVLYGLALRHGWGCTPNPVEAVSYLSAAASNAASVEKLALAAGMKKGGSAKGELVLAIFELANCFRNGWGVERDPVAAQRYYETAANLGDSDAMNETAWCYVEGYGCKKDKFTAAKYYRQAEAAGNKTLGNTWIWKDKYG